MLNLSIRTRLILWCCVPLAASVLFVGGLAYVLLGYNTIAHRIEQRIGHIDGALLKVSTTWEEQLESPTDKLLHEFRALLPGWFEPVWRDVEGGLIYGCYLKDLTEQRRPSNAFLPADAEKNCVPPQQPPENAALPLSEKAMQNAAAGRETYESVPGPDEYLIRILTRPVFEQTGHQSVLQTAVSLKALYSERRHFLTSMAAVMALGLLTVGGAGLLVRKSFLLRHLIDDFDHKIKKPLSLQKIVLEGGLAKRHTVIEYRKHMKDALKENENICRLVARELGTAEARTRRLKKEQMDAVEILEAIYERAKPLTRSRSVTLKHGALESHIINGDRYELEGALLEIVDNAVKYTDDGGCVTLSLECDDDNICFIVADSGIGFSEAETSRIFNLGYRTPAARNRGVDGSGRGLEYARAIALAHGGTLEPAARPGEGSTFRMCLPKGT